MQEKQAKPTKPAKTLNKKSIFCNTNYWFLIIYHSNLYCEYFLHITKFTYQHPALPAVNNK